MCLSLSEGSHRPVIRLNFWILRIPKAAGSSLVHVSVNGFKLHSKSRVSKVLGYVLLEEKQAFTHWTHQFNL